MSNKCLYQYQKELPLYIAELRETLTSEQVAALRIALSDMRVNDWFAWRAEHAQLVNTFVSQTHRKKQQVKHYQKHWLFLHLAAIQLCQEAQAMVQTLNKTLVCEMMGGTRAVVSRASDAYVDMLMQPLLDPWPFADPNPFESQNPPD